jgi:hypothetical protein
MTIPPPPPPPPPPNGEGGFTAPPVWQRGAPIEPRALTFTDLLDAAYNLYRLHWRAMIGFVAILVVPLQFVEQFLTRHYRHVAFLGARAGHSQAGRLVLISLVLAGISTVVVQPLLDAGLAAAVASFYFGEDPGAGQILDAALPWLGPVLFVVLLYTLAVAVGFLALIIPGILLLTGILTGVAATLIALPFTFAADHSGAGAWLIRSIGGSIGAVLTAPFSLTIVVLLYFDRRVRTEGLTLDRLSAEVSRRWKAFGSQ